MSADVHTLAGAYALDAVDDIERAVFDRHVAECPSCAQELAELRATVSRMTDLDAIQPPPNVKRAVLAAAGRTRQVAPGGRAANPARSRGWRAWAAGAAAAGLIAVAGGAVGYAISDRNTRAEHTAVVAQQRQDATVAAIMSAPDATVHVQTMTGGTKISVVVSPALNKGVAIVSDMPKLGADQAYELWLIHGAQPVSAGVLAGGQTSGTVILTAVRGAGEFGISREKAGGAAVPNVPLVASFAI